MTPQDEQRERSSLISRVVYELPTMSIVELHALLELAAFVRGKNICCTVGQSTLLFEVDE